MIRAFYNKDRQYDEMLSTVIKGIDNKLNVGEDDFLIMCVGSTGTGKSNLSLYAMEEYLGDRASVDFIGLDKSQFANALKNSKDAPLPRFCCHDEANISKRDALTKYNKDLIDLYFSIRGLRIFHWWNNPSLDIIDKEFITERIKAVIFIINKDPKIRLYYFFRKQDLLKIWEKYGDVKYKTLKKVGKANAFYRGWFRRYKGRLLEDYLKKKNSRMEFKVDDFHERWNTEDIKTLTKIGKVKKILGVSHMTVKQYVKRALDRGLIENDDCKVFATGQHFNDKAIAALKQISEELIEDRRNKFRNRKKETT